MTFFAFLPFLVWMYLIAGRGMFWLARERDDRVLPAAPADSWPSVVAVIPARDEADVVARSVRSLLQQDYPGLFRIVLIDDQSADATVDAARNEAQGREAGERLTVVRGVPRPKGWTGKLWAMNQGLERALDGSLPNYVMFTDADIAHSSDNVRKLVVRAEGGGYVLVSLMAKLHCASMAEKLLIPAFVFFFGMLFPFAWSNNPVRRTAAAAGGCMLVRSQALLAAGGLAPIRHMLIDDCALARLLKDRGRIWLGLSERAVSVRPYGGMGEIRRMIARSAYAQLGYSPLVLCGTILGMVLVYAAAPLFALFASGIARLEGAVVWATMALAFQPILRFYRRAPLWGLLLPVVGALYATFTIDSALQFWQGKGGMWKGRAQAAA